MAARDFWLATLATAMLAGIGLAAAMSFIILEHNPRQEFCAGPAAGTCELTGAYFWQVGFTFGWGVLAIAGVAVAIRLLAALFGRMLRRSA